MAKTLVASLEYEKNLLESQGMLSLYEIQVNASPAQYLYYAGYNKDVDYFVPDTDTAQTYYSAPIVRDDIEIDDGSKVPGLQVGVGAVNQVITAYIEANDGLRRNRVRCVTVPFSELRNASACLIDTYYIDNCAIDHDEEIASFGLTTKGAVADVTVPLRAYRRDQCQWKFKGTYCQYSGGDSACKHTKADCASKDNLLNFGAFPAISTMHVTK